MDYMDSQTYGFDMESYFGQIRYDYNDKYFFHGTLRRDGSSRFAKGQKWGTFGSIGAAWAITNENFMKDVSLSLIHICSPELPTHEQCRISCRVL